MHKVLVTGGSGYIGGAVTDFLQRQIIKGKDVKFTVYDTLWFENYYQKPGVDFILGDVREDRLWRNINEYDTVIWLPAVVGDAACAVNPKITRELNVDMIDMLVKKFKGKIIFASTCSVYGLLPGLLTEDSKTNPLSLYAETKLEAEYLLRQHAKNRSMIFRLGTIHGLGDPFTRPRYDLVVNVMSRDAILKNEITVFGGDQYRPMLHVMDAGKTFANAVHDFVPGIYNLAEANYSMLELAAHIVDMFPSVKLNITEQKTEDSRSYRVDASKVVKDLNFKATFNVRHGIKEMADVTLKLPDPYMRLFNNHHHMKDILLNA